MTAQINFYNLWQSLFQSVNFESRNLFDVLIISFLIFLAIKFLRETHSLPVMIGVLTLFVFYGFALLFDLSLTILVFRSIFGIFLVLVAIIFQRELRRFFSTFGFSAVARRLVHPRETIIEIIIRAVSRLAREKIGALLVFPGREPIERHFEGGYRLNGEISEPLLLSIFDKTSPGHDGAAVIEENRVKKFAVHLPLAEKIEKENIFGLRHRAALGLAEHSDALIIAVSEEKGTVSVARNGQIEQLKNDDELRKKLFYFYGERLSQSGIAGIWRWFLRNIFFLTMSFLIALFIFLAVNSRFVFVQRNFAVPPEFTNIPPQILINDITPQEIILTLEGRGSDFEVFKPGNVRVVIDVGSISNITKPGSHRIPIDAKNISLPFKLKIIKIEPSNIRILVAKGTIPS